MLLIVLALAVWIPGDERLEEDAVRRISGPFHFNLASWELQNFPKRWWYQLTHGFRQPDPTSQDSLDKVSRYFSLASQIGGLEHELERLRSGLGGPQEEVTVQGRLEQLRGQQSSLRSDVEFILESLIAKVIDEEKLTRKLLGIKYTWPPVDFTFDKLPKVLIVSPRERIELLGTHLLETNLSLEKIEQLESRIDQRDLSSLVQGIGGVATYPAIVQNTASLGAALNLVAHEWLHHHLFFHPLGFRYRASDDLTTINETVASMWGKEVAEGLLCRFWDQCPQEEEVRQTVTQEPQEETGFSFVREMIKTRLRVDELLAQGEVEEAEAFMEQQRRLLEEHGHFLRKLNQAFFAFSGSYADAPTSVNPIGVQLKKLRNLSPTLGTFIRTVRGIGSFGEYQRKVLPLVSEQEEQASLPHQPIRPGSAFSRLYPFSPADRWP